MNRPTRQAHLDKAEAMAHMADLLIAEVCDEVTKTNMVGPKHGTAAAVVNALSNLAIAHVELAREENLK